VTHFSANIARHLAAHAAAHPAQPALKVPRGRKGGRIDYLELSYAELSAEVAVWRGRLATRGVRPGDRALVMVRQGLPLIAVVFALFELGALPVVIDPGMGREAFLRCVEHSRPRVLVGIPLARALAWVFRRAFRSVEVKVAVSGANTARLTPPGAARPAGDADALVCGADEAAAILFTSGSTGAPKGVVYTHGQFDAQVRMIRATYGIEPGEVDLPLLPLFALFAPALGMTVVVPEIDPSRPAQADPAKLVQAILQEGVTTSFGSPTLWGNLSWHCHKHGVTLPGLRRVLCAGAPVPPWLWDASRRFMPNGRMHSPYGATEALPVSSIAAEAP
jgi:olefin beta-lactone synthetase